MLAKSPFEPACAAASPEDVPGTISVTDEQMLVLIGAGEGSNLAEALSRTKGRFPAARIVVVGDASYPGNVITALRFGAATFVDENMPTSSLVKELELVAMGEPVISVSILTHLLGHGPALACDEIAQTSVVDEPRQPDTQEQAEPGLQLSSRESAAPAIDKLQPPEMQRYAEPSVQLSTREAAILSHLVQGTTNKVIAYKLQITEATVKVYVKAILRKIRVKNRTQAAIWAMNRQVLRDRHDAGNDSIIDVETR